jgi:hypothetical protein
MQLIAMTKTHECNHNLCFRWRVGEWGQCTDCTHNPGYKYRVVDCVKQSPYEDSEDIVEESECKDQQPSNKESCNSNEPCADKHVKRHVSSQTEW